MQLYKEAVLYILQDTVGTITLWSTCGRSTAGAYHEWQGTVCMPDKHVNITGLYGDHCNITFYVVLSICFLFFRRFVWIVFHADLPYYTYHDVSRNNNMFVIINNVCLSVCLRFEPFLS